eukprot:RCo008113
MPLLSRCSGLGRCCKIAACVEERSFPHTGRACVQVPLWLLVGLLSVVSLIVVGVLTYFLVYTRTGEAMDSVAVSYRELGFQVVENKVLGMLGQVAMMTKLLGEQAATAAPEDIAPIELRQQTFLGISLMPIALDYMVGFRTGE